MNYHNFSKNLKIFTSKSETGEFRLQDDVEDIHSQVELLLTQKLGDIGKKIHAARSRNDQVLVDIKLFLRNELEELVKAIQPFFDLLQTQSEKYKDHFFRVIRICNWPCHLHLVYGLALMQKAWLMI